MAGESGVTRSIIDELPSSDIQRDQIEGGSGVTLSIIDELHSSDIIGDQIEGESGVTPISLMNFILGISMEIKRKAKVV